MSVSLSSEDIGAIRQLLTIVTDNNLSELTVTLREHVSVTIKSGLPESLTPPPVYYAAPPLAEAPAQSAAQPAPAATPQVAVNRGIAVTAPMVGMFYHAASPDDPPFVKSGDTIKVGQTIGLIEAMKVFSEIPSDVAGRVTEICVDNGQLLQLGQAILYLEPA